MLRVSVLYNTTCFFYRDLRLIFWVVGHIMGLMSYGPGEDLKIKDESTAVYLHRTHGQFF